MAARLSRRGWVLTAGAAIVVAASLLGTFAARAATGAAAHAGAKATGSAHVGAKAVGSAGSARPAGGRASQDALTVGVDGAVAATAKSGTTTSVRVSPASAALSSRSS
jgi:hypothetical protein